MFCTKSLLVHWIVFTYLMFACKINARIINSNEIIDHRKVLKMDMVTACQMTCFEEFLFDDGEEVNPFWNVIDRCTERSDCYMCYDFCGMLNDESRMIGKLMCTNDTCFTGCKYACVFHKLLPIEVLIDPRMKRTRDMA